MYGMAVLPLIRRIADHCKQVLYADDATGGGCILQLRSWWDALCEIDPSFCYYPNAEKTWLVVEEEHLELAQRVFRDASVQITAEGRRLLGAPLGTALFTSRYLEERVISCSRQLSKLAKVAQLQTQPHTAFSAFRHAFVNRLVFMACVTGDLSSHFQPLESKICKSFLPSLTGRPTPGEDVSALLALPPRLGGLGIVNPTVAFTKEHEYSKNICQSLTTLIIKQDSDLADACSDIKKRKKEVHDWRTKSISETAAKVTPTLLEFSAAGSGSRSRSGCFTFADSPAPGSPRICSTQRSLYGCPMPFRYGCHCPICCYTVHAESCSGRPCALLWQRRIYNHAPQ